MKLQRKNFSYYQGQGRKESDNIAYNHLKKGEVGKGLKTWLVGASNDELKSHRKALREKYKEDLRTGKTKIIKVSNKLW